MYLCCQYKIFEKIKTNLTILKSNIVFVFTLMPLGKARTHLFSPQLWLKQLRGLSSLSLVGNQ